MRIDIVHYSLPLQYGFPPGTKTGPWRIMMGGAEYSKLISLVSCQMLRRRERSFMMVFDAIPLPHITVLVY